MDQSSLQSAAAKVALAWAGLWAGLSDWGEAVLSWPLEKWALLGTLIFTVLQAAKLVRDWRLDSARRRAEAAKEKANEEGA